MSDEMRGSIRIFATVAVATVTLLVPAGGLAGGPALEWSPSSNGGFDYGSVAAGQTMSQTFTLSAGKGNVRGIGVQLSGSVAFVITDDNCSGNKSSVNAKGNVCTVTVAYSPVSANDTSRLIADTSKQGADAFVDLTGKSA